MSRFLIERYINLKAYTPGEQPQDMHYVKLNTNESPYPPSNGVCAVVNAGEAGKLNLYPDPNCSKLCGSLAELYGVAKENVFISNGSDDILNFAFAAFAGAQNEAAFPDISYGFYKVFAEFHGVKYVQIPLRKDFSVDFGDYCALGKFIALANPNAPTGKAISVSEIEKILQTNPDNVVLIDEAYVDFGAESCVRLTEKYENLLVVMTFSKSRSLAGARLGFAVGNKGLISDLNKIKYATNPYSINRITAAAGLAAVRDNAYYKANCKKIAETREYTDTQLKKLGFSVLPSKANFVFARHKKLAGELIYRELKSRGVLVRHFDNEKIKDYNRITIGTKEQMDVLLCKLKEITAEA